MFDHITLRVPDLAAASSTFAALLDRLDIEQTTSTASFSVWGNFALTQADDEHPIARRVRIAFTAPTTAHVDRFAQTGSGAGLIDVAAGEARPDSIAYAYAAFLEDQAGNSFGAVHRESARAKDNIDQLAIRVADLEASAAFYTTIGPTANLTLGRRTHDRASFSVGADGGTLLLIAAEPTQNLHVAFSGEDDDVRRFHADAVAAGYRSNGEPGERPRYHAGYYAAYVLDPDGNNIEIVNHHR
jgi:catechol 2,3-dioxygenase-like lactoylglutathione lyase family enzyme